MTVFKRTQTDRRHISAFDTTRQFISCNCAWTEFIRSFGSRANFTVWNNALFIYIAVLLWPWMGLRSRKFIRWKSETYVSLKSLTKSLDENWSFPFATCSDFLYQVRSQSLVCMRPQQFHVDILFLLVLFMESMYVCGVLWWIMSLSWVMDISLAHFNILYG